ncbi:DUF5071 domain-containing protein [Undibacterium cyanobacteriorum]|uniref:DUF5071 domain-containing protein n=1 Tax=Undibacterium cyanobacteriorum TaxID=3073561 RepID=A0ABY9RI32_9BURK|nr:DUF5071 domain-containing protein [Undibacterium sp. 20NA77.5]WMW80873.1 DUF5071 domain-containing protein [Undibacterium sp. 20NA77.5]
MKNIELIPRDKLDLERAEAAVAAGYPAVAPILPELMEWMQDMNWPVARALQALLAGIGSPLEPHIRRVLESDDLIWKYGVLRWIVAESPELIAIFTPDLQRLSMQANVAEQAEELDVLAHEILQKFC